MIVYNINQFIYLNILICFLSDMGFAQKTDSKQVYSNFIVKEVKVFIDGAFLESTDVIVTDGTITQIGKGLKSDFPVVDGAGNTLIPGLVNTHTHVWVPYQLKNAAAFGVYTLFDLHTMNETSAAIKKMNNSSGYAKLYSSGYAATVAGGHGTQYGFDVPVIGGNRSCFDFIDEQVSFGVDHIKIIYEHKIATLQLAQVDSLISRAHFYGKKVIVHISNVKDALDVAELGADGLAHIWHDRTMTKQEKEIFAKYGTFVIPTLLVYEKIIEYWSSKGKSVNTISMESMKNEVRELSAMGVMILAGTDPPNFGLDYGKSLHRELLLLNECGLSVTEVLNSATYNASKAFGHEISFIKIGEQANFIMTAGDLTQDIALSDSILARWMDGVELTDPTPD